jgi:glycosyltransferase involved in cell wall biosynthesis
MAPKLNILHVIIGLRIGGAESMLKRLIESQYDHDIYSHTVISLTAIDSIGEQLQKQGIDVQALGMRTVLDTPRVLWRLVKLIRSGQPDIVQTWMYHADLLGGLAARIAGNRNVIWGIRTTDVATVGSRVTSLVRRLCAWLSHTIPHTIVCAANASRRSHVAMGYSNARMVVLPNGFDLARLVATPTQRNGLRMQCGFDPSTVVVGYLGRFHRDKDQANFVRAAGLLSENFPHVRFLMVGRDLDEKNSELKDWISATVCADKFVLLGERSDVPVCLAAMDLFCLSSRTEGFPNVVGEAMAMGLPCVTTDVGDAAMLVADSGVVVPRQDSVALAAGLSRLLVMPSEEREELGQRAKDRIHKEFSMDRARERFEALYRQMTRKEPS